MSRTPHDPTTDAERQTSAAQIAERLDALRAAAGPDASVVETHASLVVLGAERAFKIKKPVAFPYLDFSTLERRSAACMREVEINRRFSPALYLGLGWIVRGADGVLVLDGPGTKVEPVVVMRRFAEAEVLGRRADRGALDLPTAAALAEAVAASHRAAEVRIDPSATARLDAAGASVLARLASAPEVVSGDRIAALTAALDAALTRARPTLETRAQRGFVRRCHGDLHLDNWVLRDGRPTPFDALEFDEDLATIDVLYDFTFPLMDLWVRGHQRAAALLLSAWAALERPEALFGLEALGPFLALRALVRARVAFDRRSEISDAAARDELAAAAIARITFAEQALGTAAPRLLAVGGLSGTGKSTLALDLAPHLAPPPGAVILRSDLERKAAADVPFDHRLPESAYRPEAAAAIYRRLIEKAEPVLAAGRTVVLDAVFARPDERAEAERLARTAGVPFTGLWLEAPTDARAGRVEARRGDASDADAAVAAAQAAYELGPIGWTRLDASRGAEATAAAARRAVWDV